MRYKSVYSIEYDSTDDVEAEKIARAHHQEFHDQLRVEGADDPQDIILEQVLAMEPAGQRALLPERTIKNI